MTNGSSTQRRRWRWPAAVALAILLWLTLTGSGHDAWSRFFTSLRIARPDAVSVNVPAFSGPAGSRRLQDAVASMLADTVHVAREARDSAVPDSASASYLAGFAPSLPTRRASKMSFSVIGARSIAMTVDRRALETSLRQGGVSGVTLPSSLDGTTLAIETPAGIRTESGNCPNDQRTLTDQIAQRPPPSTDNGDCVIFEQRPVATAQVPQGLDMQQLAGLAVEVAGMSPNQARDFQQIFPWDASLALTMPRFMRSYEVVQVNGRPAMLLNTAGRRGPSYELLWTASGRVYSLIGYGSSGDAVSLAESIH